MCWAEIDCIDLYCYAVPKWLCFYSVIIFDIFLKAYSDAYQEYFHSECETF